MISYDVEAFGAPLRRFERPTPAAGHRGLGAHLGGRGVPQRLAFVGRWLRSRLGRTAERRRSRRVAAVDDGPRGRRRGGLAGAPGERRRGRREIPRLPMDRLRRVPDLPSGDEHLCLQPQFIGIFRPGGYGDHLLVPHPRYLIPLGDLTPGRGGALRLLRGHDLRGAAQARRPDPTPADRGDRRRRARADVSDAA